ncbi:MAG: divalent-cation tolerance protein CutA [candidate division GAL15 bacterium]
MVVCLITVPDLESARRIAQTLVEERLAACVNLVPGVRSVYRWQGAVEEAEEVLLVVKTTQERFPALRERVGSLHPYQVPEVVSLPVQDALAAYRAWVQESVAEG